MPQYRHLYRALANENISLDKHFSSARPNEMKRYYKSLAAEESVREAQMAIPLSTNACILRR